MQCPVLLEEDAPGVRGTILDKLDFDRFECLINLCFKQYGAITDKPAKNGRDKEGMQT
ncbi:MAG: hypothetical protein OXF73_07465 [Gammaproteobacteria bacterium]|nr:hypothetical protein [Gammaproteobacteria bacterium]